MLMNILYYGVDKSSNPAGLKVGPLNLTPEQVGIGVITNLIIFPPSLLLVQLFRRSKRRKTRITKLRETLDTLSVQNSSAKNKGGKYMEPKEKKKSKKGELKFPWWFKIFAYILSFAFASVSLFFIIVQGITFGDDKVSKWLTSLVISFLTSIFLTQPLQVFSRSLIQIKYFSFKFSLI
jgi:polycystin 1L2